MKHKAKQTKRVKLEESNTKELTAICPKCKKQYSGYPAISRRDNQTPICSYCGTQEALFDFNLDRLKKEEKKWLKELK